MTKTIALVAGATGLIGNHLLDFLLGSPAHEKVIALTRRPLERDHEKLSNLVANFDQLEAAVANSGIRADEAYCALGTTIKKAGSKEAFRKVDFDYETAFARAALAAGANKFALVSAVGADARSPIFYSRVKGETERAIRDLGFASLHIFQPGVLLGERTESRPAEQLAIALTPLVNLGLQGPLRKYRGIPAKTVAEAMIAALHSDRPSTIHRYDAMAKATR
ncbi:MAG: NAD(P)H-binding protein [Rhodobiaceae bacterium]|nr:NAD(P)H-binding protein [Rhodobiaceae bacterium]